MKKLYKILCTFLIGTCTVIGCVSAPENAPEDGAAKTIVEETEEVTKEKTNPVAVASTSVAICEILEALDYDNVIGVPETSGTLPDKYADATTIGAPMNPDMEIVKSISPDVVLSPIALEASLAEQYEIAGIESIFMDLSSVQGMYDSITELGKMLDREEDAAKLVEEYEAYMDTYVTEDVEAKECMILMCFPTGYSLIATEKSYVGNLVELAGGINVYANYEGDENGFVAINPEDMIKRNPEKILVYAHYSEEETFSQMEEEFATGTTWQYYDAVKNGEVYYLSSSMFGMSASLDWTESLEYLKPILYGE